MGKKSSPAPDYTPVAQASQQASALSDQLARDQMAEARRQYEDQRNIAKPIVDAQLETMRQGINQGKDYYDYMVSRQRPIEDALQQQVLRDTSGADEADRQAILDARTKLAGTVRGIGAEQQASGEGFADAYQSGLSRITNRVAGESYGQLDELRGRSDRAVGDATRMAMRTLGTMGSESRSAISQLDGQLGLAMSDMRRAAGSAAGAGSSISANSARHEAQINADIGLYTSGNDAIRAKYGTDIENDANLALADARAGQAQATNSAIRQAMRYGLNVDSIAGGTSVANAQVQAAAANGARTSSTNKYRDVVGQGIGMRQNLMNSSNQAAIAAAQADIANAQLGVSAAGAFGGLATDRAGLVLGNSLQRGGMAINSSQQLAGMNLDAARTQASYGLDLSGRLGSMDANTLANSLGMRQSAADAGFGARLSAAGMEAENAGLARDMRISDSARGMAQKMDVAGMYRGLTGASAGAYGLAVGAGNSANGNNAAAGNMLLGQMGQSAQMQMGGRQLAMSGLTNILNNQTAYANSNQGESFGSVLGGLGGAATGAAKLYSVFGSDRRLKFDIQPVGLDRGTGLNLYSFRYIAQPMRRFVGVMADEVRRVMPSAVIADPSGFDKVDYGALGIPMVEI